MLWGSEKKFRPAVPAPLDRLTRFSTLGDNAPHDDAARTSRPILHRPPGPALHLVQGADEETACGERPVRPLHLPQMRLPAHDQAGSQAVIAGPLNGIP